MRRILVFTWVSLCGVICASELQAQSLVHLWAFENNFSDTSGSGNNGTATGTPTFVSGKFGQGVSIASGTLDGVHLDFGAANLPLAGTASWSMNVWAKLSTAPADLEYFAGWGLNDGFVTALDTGGSRAFISAPTPTPNRFYFWGGGRDVNSGLEYSTDNNWHMYTATYDGSTMNLYKDAVPIFATRRTVALNAAFDEVHVGNPSNWNSNFDGSLDQFGIFNGALNEGQVNGLYFNNDVNQPVALEVNRDTGHLVFKNQSTNPISVLGYTIRSASGSLRATTWSTIAGRYDAPPGGDGSIDNNDDWTVFTNTSLPYSVELSEGVPGTNGGTIAGGKVIDFGPAWVGNPREDIVIDLLLNDGLGTVKTIFADYAGHGGVPFALGDLDADGDIDPQDWTLFRTASVNNFAGKTLTEAYRGGDLDGDLDKDIFDFSRFAAIYDVANGSGAFAQLSSVPEPASLVTLSLGALILFGRRLGRRRFAALFVAAAALLSVPQNASAVLWGYYPFNETPNEATSTNVNLNLMGDATYGSSVHPGLNATLALGTLNNNAAGGAIGGPFNKVTTNDLTLVAWAYATSVAGDWNTIVKNWGTTAGGQFHMGLGPVAADTLQNFIANGTNVTVASAFPVGQWMHTAVVVDSAALQHRVYINGELVASGAYSGTLGAGNAAITGLGVGHKPNNDGSGFDTGGGPGPWHGRIDDVGIFNSAMTTAQIQQIYQNGLAGIQLDGTTAPYVSVVVDRSTKEVKLKNPTVGALSFSAYQISSVAGSLQPSVWQDLAGNAGFPTGNGSGNGWEKDTASDSHQMLETFLTGASSLTAGGQISLGNVFAGGTEDLSFRFRTAAGTVIDSLVEYVGVAPGLLGDYNNNGRVDGADYVLWRKKLNTTFALPNEDLTVTPGQVTAADYNVWRSHFGNPGGSGTALPVPEPISCSLMISLAMTLACVSRFGRRFS